MAYIVMANIIVGFTIKASLDPARKRVLMASVVMARTIMPSLAPAFALPGMARHRGARLCSFLLGLTWRRVMATY